MSDLLEAGAVSNDLNHTRCSSNILINNNHKRILRSKENLFKPKCNKELKKKLKKYKLRRDGNEDQDILDVSRILVTSLRIKSPNNPDKINTNNYKVDSGHQKPNNYLFKMVRRKKICSKTESNNVDVCAPQNISNICTFDEESQSSKQMDAFKLMMDSRNKSIGSNSPGKEKNDNEIFSQDIVEKKAIKAKRVLTLQKMAESKGSLKKKEIEEYRENCIKKKMMKRAELFKDMITKPDSKIDKKEYVPKSNILNNLSETKSNKEISNQPNTFKQNNKTLKLCDMFSDTNTIINESKPSERVSDEDIEFLKKLSPSIRKKENMLCYFKKVSKDMELTSEEIENNCSDETTNSIIKVKFTPKRKKKSKVLNSNEDDLVIMKDSKSKETKDLLSCDFNKLDDSGQMENNERRKRKRNKKPEENVSNVIKETKDNIEPERNCNSENRPKRNTKKPVKYTEDVHCFSSDEELHIFTPKKKRSSENCFKAKTITIVQDVDSKISKKEMPVKGKRNEGLSNLPNPSKTSNDWLAKDKAKVKFELKKEVKNKKSFNGSSENLSSKVKSDNKIVKLAPIFVSKPQLSQEAIEAKQKFLKSGVPEKLKKCVTQQANNFTLLDNFHPVFHIHQNDTHLSNYQGKDWFNLTSNESEEINIVNNYSFKSLLVPVSVQSLNFPFSQLKPEKVLKCIKSAYPKFPVYRTYHKLRSKCKGEFKDYSYTDIDNSIEIVDDCTEVNNDNPEKLNWCDKYKPTSSNQIIGNFGSIKELKRWLESWSEKLIKDKNNDSDAFDMSDFSSSDMDSRDAMRTTNNILIVTGETGSGKTSSVYAVAAELAIKVIEVNASSKRNGKIMLQDLQEATQSHKVNRAKSSTESSQKSSQSQEVPTLTSSKKRGRPKKAVDNDNIKKITLTPTPESQPSSSQECVRTGMSLILIDDADIVFDQDDGFCSAVSQLIQSSKRPVILVTSSSTCPHLQRFFQNGKTIHMRPLLPRMLGTWLDIMCLADVGKCCMGLGEKLLDFYKGDIRKTINCLQFYMNSYKSINHADEVGNLQVKLNIDDESSSMSWADSDSLDSPLSNEIASLSVTDRKLQLFPCGTLSNVFDIWWNLSSNFNVMKNEHNIESYSKQTEKGREIKKIAEVLDTLSIIDYIDHIKPDKRYNITSTPWYCSESASLLESENFDGYNEAHFINKEISNVLMTSSISEVEKFCKTEKSISGLAPSASNYSERDRIVSRHHTLSSYLNPSATLDRRATALDYWSSCRTICRLEKSKTDYNTKRNNRFCHYLKSLNILCKNDFFDNLADSLN